MKLLSFEFTEPELDDYAWSWIGLHHSGRIMHGYGRTRDHCYQDARSRGINTETACLFQCEPFPVVSRKTALRADLTRLRFMATQMQRRTEGMVIG